ncbi:MAG: carboxypeptidase regulatory-like domain-containing protein [Deltaproteobacteria bacterium]|nr:carboxypeptidase regulatory-like domain-containing protein [Deltaproteobacteria bacterium]
MPADTPLPLSGSVSGGGSCWLSGQAVGFQVEGERLLVHAYASVAAAQSDAARVACSGDRVDQCTLEWNTEVHYFRVGDQVLVHMGSPAVGRELSAVLGAPFAGPGSACMAEASALAAEAARRVDAGEVGTIRGRITRGGRALSLAVVRAVGAGSGDLVRSSARGHFELRGLPRGSYELRVALASDEAHPLWTQQVEVVTGQVTEVDPVVAP